MKVKELIKILYTVNSEAEIVFKLTNDTYGENGLEIFDITESRLHNADHPSINIIIEV